MPPVLLSRQNTGCGLLRMEELRTGILMTGCCHGELALPGDTAVCQVCWPHSGDWRPSTSDDRLVGETQ